jgi:hypothetical protein
MLCLLATTSYLRSFSLRRRVTDENAFSACFDLFSWFFSLEIVSSGGKFLDYLQGTSPVDLIWEKRLLESFKSLFFFGG